MSFLWVGVGGALGAMARYALTLLVALESFYVIAAINVVGSFCMGAAISLLASSFESAQWFKPLVMVGLLGGFTTFSAFANDAVGMLHAGEHVKAVVYMVGSVVMSVAACGLGMMVIK